MGQCGCVLEVLVLSSIYKPRARSFDWERTGTRARCTAHHGLPLNPGHIPQPSGPGDRVCFLCLVGSQNHLNSARGILVPQLEAKAPSLSAAGCPPASAPVVLLRVDGDLHGQDGGGGNRVYAFGGCLSICREEVRSQFRSSVSVAPQCTARSGHALLAQSGGTSRPASTLHSLCFLGRCVQLRREFTVTCRALTLVH